MKTIPHPDPERQRVLDALAQAVDRELDDDRAWFSDNPKRTCRVPRSFPNELSLQQMVEGLGIPAGQRSYTVVRQLWPGYRVRRFHVAKRNFMLPVTNMGCMRLWRDVTHGTTLSDGITLDAWCNFIEAELKANPPAKPFVEAHTTVLVPVMQGGSE